jgi:toxin ParE1/3/4
VKRREVILAPEAIDDLDALFEHIAGAAGNGVASCYLDRVENYVLGFNTASERGQARDDIRPGLRIVGFERRITIAFQVEPGRVTILRFF